MSCQSSAASITVGVVGVFLLLLAYFLNLFAVLRYEKWGQRLAYVSMNVLGSGLACAASGLILYWPFVALEGTWCVTSLAGLARALWERRGAGTSVRVADDKDDLEAGPRAEHGGVDEGKQRESDAV